MPHPIIVKEEKEAEDKSFEDVEGKAEEGTEPESPEHPETPLEKMNQAELIEKVKEAQQLAGKNFDLYLRAQAEIENVKKRAQREKTELAKFSNESLVKQLLPVADSLEKALEHLHGGDSLDSIREGVELTLKGLMDTLEKAGVEAVKSVGEPFDPTLHEAISKQDDSSMKPGTVVQELQKGYLLNGRLVRPSIVIISKDKA